MRLQRGKHLGGVEIFVCVGAECAHGGSFAGAHKADVGEREVGVNTHLPPERINFAHEMPLRGSADTAVAGHMGGSRDIQRDCQRAASHARGCQGCLTSCVSRPHDNHIVVHKPFEIVPACRGYT